MMLNSRSIITNDDVRLHYLTAGHGRPMVLALGWSQTAAMFTQLLDDLSKDYTVIAIDTRGHGASEKPDCGYRIAWFAADAAGVIAAFDLDGAILVGHPMGCAVISSYLEMFGRDCVSRLAPIDQAPVVTAWPDWSDCRDF